MSKWIFFFLVGIFFISFSILFVGFTANVNAATMSGSSVTLGNSRLSFKALISSGSAGSSLVTIQSGSGDVNTNHLFPGDVLCFTDAGNNVCRDNTTYTVANIVDSTHFNLTTPLTTALTGTDYAVASQSGAWTIGFTTVNQVPIGGKLIITIPMADNANGNNGIPDTASSVATSGFDLNKIGTGDITFTSGGCTSANWGTPVITAGATTVDHVITWTRATSICAINTPFVITIDNSPGIVNPAPITSGHTQGTSDVYGVTVSTADGSSNTIDSAIPRVAPVEAVLISASVDESLSLVVTGLSAGTQCGNLIGDAVTTTATSIPWGHPASPNHFYYGAQQLTVNTNATSGYVVTLQESDQMGRNGNVCTGTSPSVGNFTFGSATCIRDTACASGACSETAMADWTDATVYPGLGYSLASQSGTDAPFFYNQGSRTFNAKQLADAQGGETASSVPTIMSNAGPVSGSSIYVCYRITVPGTQPAGYYYNVAKYTATATF